MSDIKTKGWYRPHAKKPKHWGLSVLSIVTSVLAFLTILAEIFFIDKSTSIFSKNPYKGNSGVAISLGFLLIPVVVGLLLTLGGVAWTHWLKTEYKKMRWLDKKDQCLSTVPIILFALNAVLALLIVIVIGNR